MYSIRPAMENDLTAILRIHNAIVANENALQCASELSLTEMRAELDAKCAVFVLEEAGDVLGAYWLRPNSLGRGAHVANGTYIVRSDHRRRGIGKLLCSHSLQQAKLLGFRAIQFNFVVSENVAARGLWENQRFQVIGEVPEAYRTRDGQYLSVCIYHRLLRDVPS